MYGYLPLCVLACIAFVPAACSGQKGCGSWSCGCLCTAVNHSVAVGNKTCKSSQVLYLLSCLSSSSVPPYYRQLFPILFSCILFVLFTFLDLLPDLSHLPTNTISYSFSLSLKEQKLNLEGGSTQGRGVYFVLTG